MKFLILSLLVMSVASVQAEEIKLKGHYFKGQKKAGTFHKNNEIKKFEKADTSLIDRAKREEVFILANILDEIRRLDELDRDILFYKSQELSIPALQKEYPLIAQEKLKKLKEGSRALINKR